ncbi:MAG TPA: trypsin-like peptidase domain-containing protein [Terriglobia bacterium]|nr:trypsin-like peptidase domain-containing protein [Terriglobia bacterium]
MTASRLVTLVTVLLSSAAIRAAEPERSVIQIVSFIQSPVWDAPWRFEPVHRSGGTGFVIKGKRIMTNAHVVSWARQVIVHRYQDPHPYVAEIEFVAHDCDLALLSVEDPRFFENLEPLEFGELPKVRSAVVTYGYPAGGEEISYTRGVVSRIQLEPYAHIGNRQFLTVQTDAAINPGNSGGPVIQDDRVVGVAFQGQPGLENTGFFIPPPVIDHFLKDISDGKYDGVPQAGIRLVSLQNPAHRQWLKLSDENSGARIDSIVPIPSTESILKADDVILKVGTYSVASDGTILYQGNRLSSALGFQSAQSGESIPLEIWRDGKKMDVALPVHVYEADHAAGYQYTSLPRYFVYAGLVFTPLSLDYLRTLGRPGPEPSNADLYYELYYRRNEKPETVRPEPIVLASVLSDAVNANLTTRGKALVDRINGIRITKLEDAIRAFDSNTNAYDMVEFLPHHNIECLDRGEVAKANPTILKTYGISQDRRL